MIDFTLSEEQVAIGKMVRELMEEQIGPRAREIDEKGEYPQWVHDLFRKYDLFASCIPVEYGGVDGLHLTHCLVIEQVARVCASSSMIIGIQSLGSGPIIRFGNEEQKQRWLPALAAGEKVCGFGLTEPNAGTDARAITSRAVRADGGWRLNGRKCFITHANVADVITVFAQVDVGGRDRITAFLLETDGEGFTVDKIEHKMGLRGSPTCSFVMEDFWLPEENVLGEVGQGLEILQAGLHRGRIGTASQALGIAQGALERSAAYVGVREQFGRPLAEMQAVQQIGGEMATQVSAARCLTYVAAAKFDSKAPDLESFSAMAKLFATDTAMKVTTDAIQIMGGYGYMVEYEVERMMRDAKIFQIFEGTNQLHRGTIAQSIFSRAVGLAAE